MKQNTNPDLVIKIRSRLFGSVFLMIILLTSSFAEAILNGGPDNNKHPSVGGLVSSHQYSDGTWLYCSGTLISATVFLTAAHCDTGATRVSVTFSSNYKDGDKVYAGTMNSHPNFRSNQNDPYDIAVVVLDQAVEGIEPSSLPGKGAFAKLSGSQQFTSVGFGAYEVINAPGGKQLFYNDVRSVAVGTLNAVNPSWLRISQNASTGNGGTCYGDSGGPNFLGADNIIAAITITGDAYCRSTNVAYRLDTTSARDFLKQFVKLP